MPTRPKMAVWSLADTFVGQRNISNEDNVVPKDMRSTLFRSEDGVYRAVRDLTPLILDNIEELDRELESEDAQLTVSKRSFQLALQGRKSDQILRAESRGDYVIELKAKLGDMEKDCEFLRESLSASIAEYEKVNQEIAEVRAKEKEILEWHVATVSDVINKEVFETHCRSFSFAEFHMGILSGPNVGFLMRGLSRLNGSP